MSRPTVAIIGSGASACLAAAQLARCSGGSVAPRAILVIGPGEVGRGIAYGTTDLRHRLNVPAAKISAWPERPDHFLDWLRRTVDAEFPGAGFAARRHYGTYLRQCLDEALADSPNTTLRHVPATATHLRR